MGNNDWAIEDIIYNYFVIRSFSKIACKSVHAAVPSFEEFEVKQIILFLYKYIVPTFFV